MEMKMEKKNPDIAGALKLWNAQTIPIVVLILTAMHSYARTTRIANVAKKPENPDVTVPMIISMFQLFICRILMCVINVSQDQKSLFSQTDFQLTS